jgi:hypothetical protein
MIGCKVLLIFFLGCIPWITAISIKYKKITLSEAAAFNMSKDVAPLPGRSGELPVLGVGLLEPTENSLSGWETPGAFVSEEKINLFHATGDYLMFYPSIILIFAIRLASFFFSYC